MERILVQTWKEMVWNAYLVSKILMSRNIRYSSRPDQVPLEVANQRNLANDLAWFAMFKIQLWSGRWWWIEESVGFKGADSLCLPTRICATK
jgi:hypothetical protein